MVTRDKIKLYALGCALLWLGLMIAPSLVVADELQHVEHPTIDFLYKTNGVTGTYREIYLERNAHSRSSRARRYTKPDRRPNRYGFASVE